MTIQKQTPIVFNDQYINGYWTEYHNTTQDDVLRGKSITESFFAYIVNATSSVSAITGSRLIVLPNRRRIRVGSKSFGYCDGLDSEISYFESGPGAGFVFNLYDYKELKEKERPVNPQRFVIAYNNLAFTNDGKELGVPYILDSIVPQPPNYILAMSGQLTSQWSYTKLSNSTFTPNYRFAEEFKQLPFRKWAPFAYNFTDEYINNMWTKINIDPALSSFFASTVYERVSEYSLWFDQENIAELSAGNHIGGSLLPLTESYQLLTSSGGRFEKATPTNYLYNSFSKGPVHIGIGKCDLQVTLNTVETYHNFSSGSDTLPLDVFRDPLHDYFTPRGDPGERSFIFYNTGAQPNLNIDWLYAFPNEHRFKNIPRETRVKRSGDSTWGLYSNASYTAAGWKMPIELTEHINSGSVNDQKLGTMFWKFDYGHCINKYFSAALLDALSVPLPPIDPTLAIFKQVGGKDSFIITQSTVYSPTIILGDYFVTPNGNYYSSNVEYTPPPTTTSVQERQTFAFYPKGMDLYDPFSRLMQFSMSVASTYPKIQDLYKCFYGYGDGITTHLSEYVTDSLGSESKWATQSVDDEPWLAHRKKFIWGRDKIPSFKNGYQNLHSMRFTNSFFIEQPVLFFTGSAGSRDVAMEPEIQNISTTQILYWPDYSGDYGPLFEKPKWWEGPYVVSGPILRGFKYGLFDCIPKVPKMIYRRDKFGQPRDMLEQRKYYATKYSKNNGEDYNVLVNFVSGSEDKVIWDNYNNWQPGDPQPINVNDSGLYDIRSRVGKPFNESGWTS